MLCMYGLPVRAFAMEDNQMIPIVVQVPDDWKEPNLWVSSEDEDNAFSPFPGDKMERLDDEWYYIYIPNSAQNVVVIANQNTEESVQTNNIEIQAGVPVWILISGDNVSVFYEVQNSTPIPEYIDNESTDDSIEPTGEDNNETNTSPSTISAETDTVAPTEEASEEYSEEADGVIGLIIGIIVLIAIIGGYISIAMKKRNTNPYR